MAIELLYINGAVRKADFETWGLTKKESAIVKFVSPKEAAENLMQHS
jgi:hypothetical protein